MINKARCLSKRVVEAGYKSRMTLICLIDIFAKVYSAVICRICISLYGIKFSTKLLKVFGYR